MPNTKATSPARSQGCITTPKRKPSRGSRSLCSPALSTASGRLTSLLDQFKDKNMESFALSPLNGRSVLNDNTEIEEPRRKSWWKKLGENSQDVVMEVLEDNQLTDVNDIIEEFIDIEVLSQERKNYTLDLPESSDNESINSIVLPQRRLFTQKENQPQKKYGHLIDNRESLAKLHKTNTANIEKSVNVAPRDLFQNTKRSKPIFPAALLNISPNKTKENMLLEPKPQVRNIFGNRPANKRKNMFADFIVSESEDEIPEIEPKIFGFQKKIEQRRISSISRGRDGSPGSSITTDIEMDFRMLLPSSTMVENQLEDNMLPGTPIKRARLSKLSEAKESEAGTNTLQTNTTGDKTKQSNKSVSSKNKSRASTEIRDKSLNTSRTTRSMLKNASKRDEDVNTPVKQDTKSNKSLGKNSPKDNEINISPSTSDMDKQNKSQKQNSSKVRHSPKAADNEVESEEKVAHAINNVTRVINKSTNKPLPNTTNKSVNEKERTITIKVHEIGADDVKQNEQEDDENNFTLQYENDNENIEEPNLHNDLNDKQKDNTKAHNTVVLEKEIQETKMNLSNSNKSSVTNKSMQKQKPAKTVEESVESQTEQQSADDNIDGNVEQKREMINQQMGEDINSREVSSEQMEQENENEVQISQEIEDDHNERQEEVENESQEVENESQEVGNEGEESEAGGHQSNKMDDDLQVDNVDTKAIENEEEESEAEVTQGDKMADDLEMDRAKAKDDESDGEESEADANQGDEMDDDLEMDGDEAKDVESDGEESENESDKMADDQEMDSSKAKDVESDANDSEADVTQGDKMDDDLEMDGAEAKDVESDGEESEADVTQGDKMDDDLEMDGAEAKDVESDGEESEDESDKMADDLEMDSSKAKHIESDGEESEADATQSDKMDDDLEMDSTKEEDNENEEESEDDVNQSDKMDDDLQMDSAEDDKAIASDSEMSDNDDYQADEIEADDVDEQSEHADESEHNQHESQEEPNEVQPSSEEIDQSPNITHDTTGRYRKKDFNKSPEVILNDKTNQMDSFLAKGRNSSVRKTKSMIINLNKPSLATIRNSTGSACTTNSSAEGSGWDSHRITRKTLRQTFGKDFTPRKSLRALVMEKSAKRQTEHTNMALHSESVKFPLANSTEMPEDSNHYVEDIVESDHEVSARTRQTTLEMYLAKIKEQNIAENLKIEQAVRNSLKGPVRDIFKIPNKPAPRRPKPAQSKPKKQIKSMIPFAVLPTEVIEDMKYKPPKRFQPANACWITKRLYKYLETKLEPKYDYKARVRAEKLVETLYHFTKDLRRRDTAPVDAVEVLKHEFARLDVVRTHFEFYEFFNEFIPREIRIKVVPDIVNKIPLPRHGIFSDILI